MGFGVLGNNKADLVIFYAFEFVCDSWGGPRTGIELKLEVMFYAFTDSLDLHCFVFDGLGGWGGSDEGDERDEPMRDK